MEKDFLEPLTSLVKRKQFVTVDIESRKEDRDEPGFTRPFLIGIYDGERYLSYRNSRKGFYWEGNNCGDKCMLELLKKDNLGKIIYAHNGGRFDFLFFLPWLQNVGRHLGFSFSIVPIQSAIQVLDVWLTDQPKKGKWRFLDSIRLLPMALDKAAKSFGLEGKLTNFKLETPEASKEWEKYNEIDCVQLYKVLEKFHSYVEDNLGGEVGITSPSTSMRLFRRRYLKSNLERHKQHHTFIRKAYYGGRVEVFKKYGENLSYFDINSSYPYSMTQAMPAGEATEYNRKPPARILDSNRIGFVEALIDYPEVNIPALPVKYNQKLLFPVGKLAGVWPWEELRLAIEQGAKIVSWGKSVWFEERLLFTEMVEELYKYRDKNSSEYDEGLAAVCKLLLNSLYGKFGMNPERVTIVILNDGEPVPIGAVPIGDIDSGIYYVTETKDAPYIIPQISAHITSLSRLHLLRGMLDIEKQGFYSYYCDTDAIVCDSAAKFESSSALGGWKNEYPGVKLKAKFLGPKMYVLEAMNGPLYTYEEINSTTGSKTKKQSYEKVVAKGFNREHRNSETLHKLQRGEKVYFDRLQKVATLARAGFKHGPQMVETCRSIASINPKRNYLADNTSTPLHLTMWT